MFLSRISILIAVASLGFIIDASAEPKPIRLRNEVIDTDSGTNRAVLAAQKHTKVAVSGLYLLQFDGPLEPGQRAELRGLGVDLVRYVPEDAFIARLEKVSPATVGALSYVRWIGPYRTEHKIQNHLADIAPKAARSNETVNVNILLSPNATKAELAGVKAHLMVLYHESHLRQGVIVHGELSPGQLEALAQSSAVLWVERAPKRKLVDEAAAKIVGGDDGQIATRTITQQLGFDGRGVTVCVADTGLDTGNTNTMHPDLLGRVTGFQYYGSNITDGSDGYGHGTHCAGIVAGNAASGETDPDSGQYFGLGVASGAKIYVERIFDEDANEASPFPTDETMTHDAVRHGAKIGSNSWGNDVQGDYDTDCAQFDELVRDADAGTPGYQPYILEFSSGNAGPGSQTVGSPASAKNVIATGASDNVPGTYAQLYGLYADGIDTMADFSSRGPCADGRIKPDVVAPGTWIASAASRAAPNEAAIAWTAIDDLYVYMGGTSMAGPHAAGAAAVFVQFYQATHTNAVPSPALVKAALINSADELDEANGGPSPVPNNDEGWGRINLENIITTNFSTAPRAYQYVDQTTLLTNGQVYTQHIFVRSANEPLKVTLAYTDVPGFPGAIPALVNDLDLEVVAPDGRLYRGNQFGAGESVPNAPTPDKLNNVEGVLLSAPAIGDYQVRVRGTKIVQDALTNTPAIDQDFALVTSGDLARAGQGLILLDRSNYTAPGVMQITVLDAARAASNTVSVVVTNLTTHKSVTNILSAAGNYGAFTGAVATVTGVAGVGQIQIANGDNLEADYIDAGAVKRSATAIGDFIPPSISGVNVTIDLGVITITWTTPEPATSLVRYGTNTANLNLAVTNTALVTSHSVKLTRLIAGKTYYFLINSIDAAGNSGTNNNSGAFFTFTGVATPTVLLVDDYDTAGEENVGTTVIPDSAYTNVLAAAGVSYGFWKVTARGGSPQLADLQPYPVVIWRTTDDIANYGVDPDTLLPDPTATNNTLNAHQQFMIQTYLNGGGAFFMSSLNILTALGDVSFRHNVLQVGGFIENPAPPFPNPDGDEDHGVPAILGAPRTLASGLNQTLNYTNYPTIDDGIGDIFGPDFSDTFTPAAGATPILFESESGKPCGMSYPAVGADSPGRVVFISFPMDTMPTNGPATNNAVAFMRNVIQFLTPGLNGVGVVKLDSAFYTTNAVATVEVGDSDLAGTGQTTATFGASSRTNRTTVTLFETTHPGLFHGFVTLVAGVAGTNQLRVQNGDTITATYFDTSNNSNVTATATIDTIPPVISQVAAVTDIANAQVTWRTSEPADSSVQYSESPLPDRVGYASRFVTNHVVNISGLAANRVYYYQVVSTDPAGNTTVDDNHGNLYSFQTLKAPAPPWFDDLESGAHGWSVVPYSGSDINWTLGKPNNGGPVSSAFSGTNTWGSNLNGQSPALFCASFLYSPLIDLSGVSDATLTFETYYDFTGGIDTGQLGISTNTSTAPIDVATLVDYSGQSSGGGWTQETVDLTPFAGQTIQVVWFYFGGDSGPGWLIDDVSITNYAAAAGNIKIIKNLGQGTWSLSSLSPIGLVPVQSGVAPSITISNLTAGPYVVQFGDVPYYQTPPDTTNTLAAGGTVTFTGTYDFPDANNNGISDAWEVEKFGVAVTNRTQLTDTDHDGMTDYAEFIAGTNPTNAASRLYFTGETFQGNGRIQLNWPVVTNRLYQVAASTNLHSWQSATTWWQASNNPTMSYTTTNTGTMRFYRVQVQP